MGICVSCRRRERKAPEKRTVPGAGGPAKGAAAAELLPRRGDRLPMMANSMPNYKMTNPIKGIVSKRRRRYMKDGFNLDLAYITDRLIAMGFPAEKLEGVYRNHIDEVYRFLEKKHKDHYKIYNLCSERSYDSSKFHERVVKYAFEDHTPPNIEMIQPFCEDVDKWLCEDSRNVAAVHCKAGKGRTGTMVCCYLLYSRQKTTADEALKFYGTKRTHDEKGVTIPSQRRYVEYYAWLLRSGLSYAPTKVHIRELLMTPPPFQHGHATPELLITQARPFFKAPTGCHEVRRTDTSLHVRLEHCTPLCGDVRLDVYKHKMKMRKEKLFHFWFNTFFVASGAGAVPHPPLPDSPNLETFKLTLNKWQLDDAHKDKQHKAYSQDFKVELIVQKMPSTCTLVAAGASSPPSSTASSVSSGSEPEPDAHWDSGEPFPYTRLPSPDIQTQQPYDHKDIHERRQPYDNKDINDPQRFERKTSQDIQPQQERLQLFEQKTSLDIQPQDHKDIHERRQPYDHKDIHERLQRFEHKSKENPSKYAFPTDGFDKGMGPSKLSVYPDSFEYKNVEGIGSKQGVTDGFGPKQSDYGKPADGFEQELKNEEIGPSNSAYSGEFGPSKQSDYGPGDNFRSNLHHKAEGLFEYPESMLERLCEPTEYAKRKNSAPTVNPLYCSKADEKKYEAMEYGSDVFASAPTSARESPVEDKKRTEDRSKPRLSLDIRASWREFSGKFASDRRVKDES